MKALLCKLFGWYCATQPNPVPVEAPKVETPKVEAPADIETIVMQNGCKDIQWKDRGKINQGFFVGMAKTYAQAKCDKFLAEKLTRPVTSPKDALMKYGINPTLPNVFTFVTGLAVRESSGRACTGRDMSAGFTASESAESGLTQASLDSKAYAPYLYPFFKSWNKQGFESDFYRTVKCSAADWKYWGTGADGLAFQKLSKEKPAFQVEYAALIMRENFNHFGPIKRMEVQYFKSCVALFESIDAVIQCKNE